MKKKSKSLPPLCFVRKAVELFFCLFSPLKPDFSYLFVISIQSDRLRLIDLLEENKEFIQPTRSKHRTAFTVLLFRI